MARRGIKGRRVWIAHRDHIYQKLVSSGLSHERVTVIYGILASVLTISVLLSVKFGEYLGFAVLPAVLILTAILFFICFRRKVFD
jgi:putative Ca2+/H+ antiporter (TMEM165/GDT1 family)